MALTHERHFARRFCRYSGNIAMRYFLHNQKVVRETLCVSSAQLFFAGNISPRQKWTKVRITKSEISMRTWRSPMSATSQGAFVVMPETSHSDISYITREVCDQTSAKGYLRKKFKILHLDTKILHFR